MDYERDTDSEFESDITVDEEGQKHSRLRILRNTAFLPAVLTLLNGLCGLGSIHFATKAGLGVEDLSFLQIACLLIFVALVCDMLDGRLARMTRNTSDFGAQLDSLCDVISFGVAPALLALRCSVALVRSTGWELPLENIIVERVLWCISGIYVSCAVLRLARFNVECDEAEESHMSFKGLPAPGAAACIAMITLLYIHLAGETTIAGRLPRNIVNGASAVILPSLLLTTALLMVSRFEYLHLANHYIKGSKPVGNLVKFVFILVPVFLEPHITLSAISLVYIFSGPFRALYRFVSGKE